MVAGQLKQSPLRGQMGAFVVSYAERLIESPGPMEKQKMPSRQNSPCQTFCFPCNDRAPHYAICYRFVMDPSIRQFKSVAVFCGAAPGNSPVFMDAAKTLGQVIAKRGMTLVYGGGTVGMMGQVADSVDQSA
jgi:hypothetical protein